MRHILLSVVLSVVFLAPARPSSADPQVPQVPHVPQVSQVPQAPQQAPPRYDETVVVTADREAELISDTGSSVSVITTEQIAASGARWLIDVLQFAPGVTVARSGPPGSAASAFLRGANSSHTLFLIDGVRVNSPTTGAYDITHLQLAADQIERIEIVRGPQSTLYGSQAIGGVINVITRAGAGAGTWGIEGEGGSYATGRLHTWANGEWDSLRYTGSLSYFDSEGFSAADRRNGNPEPDGYDNLSYNARLDYRSDGGLRARGYARGFSGDALFDGYGFPDGPVDAGANTLATRELYAGGGIGIDAERLSVDVDLSISDLASESLTPEDFFTASTLDAAIWELDGQSTVALTESQQLTAGAEYRREQATIGSEFSFGEDGYDEHVDVAAVFLQDRLSLGERAWLAAGVRYEVHSTYGGAWTGRFTATVDATDVVRLHGSVGSAFKAPTLNDLYYPGFSNPDLQPEESVGYDFGVEAAAGRARAGITWFRNDITDLIQFDAAAGIPRNIGEVATHGVEVDGDVTLSAQVQLAGNYTFTSTQPHDSDRQLIRRPRHQAGVRLAWLPSPALQTWAEVRFKGERSDNGANGPVELDPFALVNVAADYRIAPQLTVRGRIENLFDAEYEEVWGYGAVGLSGYLGLTVTLARQ